MTSIIATQCILVYSATTPQVNKTHQGAAALLTKHDTGP